jgi:TP901 family phage tail tape measure protein
MSNDLTLSAILRLNIDQFTQALSQAQQAMTGAMGGIADALASAANQVLLTEAALATLATTLGTLAVKEAATFADSLYLVQKQLGDSGTSIGQAQADIERLAAAYGLNANAVAQSMAGFLAAGYDYANSAQTVDNATQLMIAGELDAVTATEAITRSIAGFRVPLTEAGAASQKVGDILNKIGDISSGKFEEIVQGFSRISPTAKDAGLTMEETAARIAVLVDIFGSGEIAASALQSGLLSLISPSKEAAATLTALGVKTTDSNGAQKQSKVILGELAGQWGALSAAQRQQAAATIFGKEQAGAMSALLGDWAKGQGYLTQMLDQTTGAVGSMAREVAGKLTLISTATAQTGEAWRQFQQHLGAKILGEGELSGLVKSVGAIGTALKTGLDAGALDPLFANLRARFAALEATLNTVAQNLPAALNGIDWSGLTGAIDQLAATAGALFRDIFGHIDLTSVAGLHQAIQLVVDSIATLTLVTAGILDEFRPLATAAGEAVRQFNALDDASKMDLGATLGIGKLISDLGALGLALVALGRAGVDVAAVVERAFAAVTYGEWQSVSGAAVANQRELGAAVGAAGEQVRALGRAYQEAASFNAKFSPAFDATGAAALKTELDAAQAKYTELKTALEQAVPPLVVETDTAAVDAAKVKVESIDGITTFSDHTIDTNAAAALSDINALDGHDTSSTHTIYVKQVETNALGGLVGLARRFAAGGAVPGFPIPRWSTVPGHGNEDSVPAALEPGAFVLRQSAARYYGSSLLDLVARFAHGGRVPSLLMPGERLFAPATVDRLGAGFFADLNALRLPRAALASGLASLGAPVRRFADGGLVAPALAGAAADIVNINFQLGRQTIRLQGAREQANVLASALRELQRTA